MAFRITGLSPEPFRRYYGLSDTALAAEGVIRCAVDASPGFPDRITLRDIDRGGSALLLNWEHLPVNSPYRSRHAIFVAEGAEAPFDAVDEVPEALARRILALRGIDGRGHIVAAALAEGAEIVPKIRQMLEAPEVGYIQAHYAMRGCFAARVDRA
ncbi:DUF1203 domain-containing protein [Acidimangrovimonas sediminis]|uniref:DUF1203 domain-containing protein n=1 Tax=Acidimangrovimonas sediminis TaxID=2056283 RepID=UPI000C800C84|nr:DUF1203 domain-containing protein [Acidimangrovimonas sediminis]